jgi:hypothetical protein
MWGVRQVVRLLGREVVSKADGKQSLAEWHWSLLL